MTRTAIAKLETAAAAALATAMGGHRGRHRGDCRLFVALHALETRTADYFLRMRTENPAIYLEQLRESQGFADFLTRICNADRA